MTDKSDIRRSLSISGENDTRILNNRASFMGRKDMPVDVDYTTMVNICIELADMIMQKRQSARDDTCICCGLTFTTDNDIRTQIDEIIEKYIT